MDTIRYPKTTLLLGELSEPWRLENTLKPMAQEYLDVAATCLRVIGPHRLTVGDAYSLYADRLCEAIDINLGITLVTSTKLPICVVPAFPSRRDCDIYPELRHEQ